MESKFTNRYNSFCNCLNGLKNAKYRDASDDFVLSGTVQKFNLSFDIAWKVMKDIIVKYHMINYASGSPRETLREAYSVGLIEDDMWMEMLKTRNELAHDYDGEMAMECFQTILDEYLPLLDKFRIKASEYTEKIV